MSEQHVVEPVTCYKVVRREENGELRSAIVCNNVTVTYAPGEETVAKHGGLFVFGNLTDAEIWLFGDLPWSLSIGKLFEIWSCTCVEKVRVPPGQYEEGYSSPWSLSSFKDYWDQWLLEGREAHVREYEFGGFVQFSRTTLAFKRVTLNECVWKDQRANNVFSAS